jgi:glutathione-independent formaldehyde dehydrogenase
MKLTLAEQMGATPVNFAEVDPADVIMDGTDGFGVDCRVEAVGYQAHDATGQEHPELVLDNLVSVVRATGRSSARGSEIRWEDGCVRRPVPNAGP